MPTSTKSWHCSSWSEGNTNSVYEQRQWPVVRQAHHEREKDLPFALSESKGADTTFSNKVGISTPIPINIQEAAAYRSGVVLVAILDPLP